MCFACVLCYYIADHCDLILHFPCNFPHHQSINANSQHIDNIKYRLKHKVSQKKETLISHVDNTSMNHNLVAYNNSNDSTTLLPEQRQPIIHSISNDSDQICLSSILSNSTLLLGLHADGATESIIDYALQYQKPFAVVPCCVFADHFPDRTFRSIPINNCHHHDNEQTYSEERPVRSYEDYLIYLQQKDPRIQRDALPFQGRNVVLFMLPQ